MSGMGWAVCAALIRGQLSAVERPSSRIAGAKEHRRANLGPSVATQPRMLEPKDITRAEKWLLIMGCSPVVFAGLLFLFA
jgi:hypothetical protein